MHFDQVHEGFSGLGHGVSKYMYTMDPRKLCAMFSHPAKRGSYRPGSFARYDTGIPVYVVQMNDKWDKSFQSALGFVVPLNLINDE